MKRATALSVVVLICFGIHAINATYCKPLSRFKVDCNYCMCTKDGSKYACTYKICNKRNEFNIVNDEAYEDEYISAKKPDGDDRIPYINDEIPSSREDLEEVPLDVNLDDYLADRGNDDPRFEQRVQDIDLDDQDAENFGLGMEDYRIRRDIFI